MKSVRVFAAAAAVVLISAAGPVFAQTPASGVATAESAPIATRYGRLPATEFVTVSPSGRRLAYVTVVGEARSLLLIDPATGDLLGGARLGENKIRSVTWVGDDQVLIESSATQSALNAGLGRGEWFTGAVYDIPTRTLRQVLDNTRNVVPVLAGSYVRTIGGRPTLFVRSIWSNGGGPAGWALYRIDPTTSRGYVTEQWAFNATPEFVLAADGTIQAKSVYYSDSGRWVLQLRRGTTFYDAWRTDAPLDQPSLEGLGRTEGSVVVWAARDGRPAQFYEVDVATGEWTDLPFSGPIAGLIRHPQSRLVIGAFLEGSENSQIEMLDPVANRTYRSVMAAFPGRHPKIVSWSNDMRTVVADTWGGDDSGSFQFVDLNARVANIIGETYPLVPTAGEVRSISYAAADGMTIPGYLTLPPGVANPRNLPLVVMPHGGPQARDYLGFDWWAQAMAARGYAVLQPNYRGSDGLGEAHLQAGYGEWGGKMQSDLSDGVRWLASQGVIDPGRVCIVGASYGGYAALAGPTIDPGVYRCAVAVAGVSDLRRMVEWSSLRSGANNSPTVRYWNRFMGADRVGDRSLDARSPRQQAARADAPILMIHGRDDTVVPFEQSRMMADALRDAGKPFELVNLGAEDHWLSRADTREKMLSETLRWLDTYNPAGAN